MRILVIGILLSISSCATTAPDSVAGGQRQDYVTEFNRQFNENINDAQSDAMHCRSVEILWCSAGEEESNCRCLPEQDIVERLQRVQGAGYSRMMSTRRRH